MVDPRQAVVNYIDANYNLSGWTTIVNKGWFETKRETDKQIYLPTHDGKYINKTTYSQRDLDRQTSPITKEAMVFVYVSASDKDTRDSMAEEMERILLLPTTRNPETLIDYLILQNSYPQNQDKKNDCLTWVQIFEIKVLY